MSGQAPTSSAAVELVLTRRRLLSPPALNNLKVLRTQAVLAIHQSGLRSSARTR